MNIPEIRQDSCMAPTGNSTEKRIVKLLGLGTARSEKKYSPNQNQTAPGGDGSDFLIHVSTEVCSLLQLNLSSEVTLTT